MNPTSKDTEQGKANKDSKQQHEGKRKDEYSIQSYVMTAMKENMFSSIRYRKEREHMGISKARKHEEIGKQFKDK